jgi:hypothetical protein
VAQGGAGEGGEVQVSLGQSVGGQDLPCPWASRSGSTCRMWERCVFGVLVQSA